MSAYISEVKYSTEANDYIEVAVPAGTDISGYSVYIYRSNGTIQRGPESLGTVESTAFGQDVYIVAFGGPTLGSDDAIALVDDTGTVIQLISFNGNTITATEGPASGLTSTDVGHSTGSVTLQSTDGGATYAPAPQSRGTIPCYAPGTMIDTPQGPVPVETLCPGDMVSTKDHGAQPILWTRKGSVALDGMDSEQRPVLIRRGALGPERPVQDLTVSPQHRILIGAPGQLPAVSRHEVFAPAKSLTGLRGIRHVMGKSLITWVHFACARQEVVRANGCWSESLLLGPMVLNGLNASERQGLRLAFPQVGDGERFHVAPARRCLGVQDMRRTVSAFKARTRTVA